MNLAPAQLIRRAGNELRARIKQLIDPYPVGAVSRDPWQFWQKGYDGQFYADQSVAAAEGGLDAYAQAIAQMGVGHVKHVGQAHKPIANSEFSELLRNPNGYQTRSDFMNSIARRLMSAGNGYAVAERDRYGRIIALHPVLAPHCEAYADETSKDIFYSVSGNPLAPFEHGMLIPQRDVFHVKLYAPYHPLRGVSPLTYAALAMTANRSLAMHQANFFTNMTRPSFLLQTDEKLSADQMRQLRAAWDDQAAGMNSGRVPILSFGLKAQQLGISSQDAQLVQAFKMTVEDIGRALRIPAPLMGIDATYNNTEQLIGFWLSNGLGFVINHIEQALSKFFDLPANESIEFVTEDLMRVDYTSRVSSATAGILGGLFSPNEARSKFNLPAVEFGDEPRLQAQVIPLSQVGNIPDSLPTPDVPDSAPVAPDEEPEQDQESDPAEPPDDEEKAALAYMRIKKVMGAGL